jgi:hypothetical protein
MCWKYIDNIECKHQQEVHNKLFSKRNATKRLIEIIKVLEISLEYFNHLGILQSEQQSTYGPVLAS